MMKSDPIVVAPSGRVAIDGGRIRLSSDIRVDAAERFTAWVHIPAESAPATDDWLVPIMIVRAMQLARPVHIAGRVSAKLLAGAHEIQRMFAGFSGAFQPRPITADETIASPAAPPQRTASFFSGGLDSWYSALAGGHEIDDLVFGAGIDMPADNLERRALIEPVVREAVAALGKPLVQFETNLRECYRPWKNWSECFLGSALASCALAMGGRYTRFLIGGAHNEHWQHLQWGTSAVIDPHWSSGTMQIVHDGAISRVEKARMVATNSVAMRTLRVCWRKDIRDYNCCKCEKCLRTMTALRIVGALDRCVTFNRPLDLGLLAAQRHGSWSSRSFVEENLVAAEAAGTDPALVEALRLSLSEKPVVAPAPAAALKPKRSLPFKIRREVTRAFRKVAALFTGRAGAAHK